VTPAHGRHARCLPRPIFGRVCGVLIAFLVPFLDIGIGRPMLRTEPPDWARVLPGYGADRVILDGGLTAGFDATGSLLLALAWLTALSIAAAFLFRSGAPARPMGLHSKASRLTGHCRQVQRCPVSSG
jgi:hypothetical protein